MERSPRRTRRRPAVAPALAAFALSGALAFVLLRPGAPEAGLDHVPLATSGPVQLFGELARGGAGEGWVVRVRAVNGGEEARRCRVTAVVTELRDSPMSRVVRMPRPLWTTEVALGVDPRGTARAQAALPAATAARLSASRGGEAAPSPAPRRAPSPARETITHGVQLQATCEPAEPLG